MAHDQRPAAPEPYITKLGETRMKNPLDSLGQTIILGFVLTVIVVLLIHAIA